MKLRAELIDNLSGPLPTICILSDGYRLELSSEKTECDCCPGMPLIIRWTPLRHPVGIMLGKVELCHRIKQCPQCKRRYEFEGLDRLLPPHKQYAYDAIVAAGRSRFCDHKQDGEIVARMKDRWGLQLPLGSVCTITGTFLDYFGVIHYTASERIKRILDRQGGYVMCMDGTCELGTDVLFSLFDGLSGLVLVTGRMKSENTTEIKALVDRCIKLFGMPLATVRDLSNNIRLARAHLPEHVKDFLCEYHFLENVGERLLEQQHRQLTRTMTNQKIRSRLRSLRKDMVKASKTKAPISAEAFQQLMDNPGNIEQFDLVQLRRRLAHLLMKWIEDYKADLSGEHFPFDLPTLALYDRCVRAYDFIDEVLRSVSLPQQYKQTLQTIHSILSPVHSDEELRAIAKRLEIAREPFEELRAVLRFTRSDNTGIDRRRPPTVDLRLARECKQRLRKFTMRLQKTADDPADQSRAKDACIVLAYLDKYRDGLHGRLLNIKSGNCKQVLVPRTNHIAEQHFGRIKRKWRRRLGTAKLTRRQQAARPEELLVANLENSQYIDAVYGGNLATMPERFAEHHASVIEARQLSKESDDDQSMHTPRKTIRDENLFSKMGQTISALAACLA